MKKQVLYAPLTESSAMVSNVVNVSTRDELYEEINDPANEGRTIVLAQGTYSLSSNYPKGGRLELLHNMSLMGQENHPELVIIDASALDITSFEIPPSPPENPFGLRKGVVRVGNGSNSVEWLTLQNDPTHDIRSLIQTDLVATSYTKVRIAHTVIQGSSIGLNIVNWRTEHHSRTVEADIEDNEIRNNTINSFGSAIQIQNSHAVTGAVIKATLNGNRLHGNKSGISIFHAQSVQNSITVRSNGDMIENNGVGLALVAGNSASEGYPGARNTILFEAQGTTIRNNLNVPSARRNFLPGGVFAAAGYVPVDVPPGTADDNKLEVTFHGCPIKDNFGQFQINAFGAYSLNQSSSEPAGSGNETVIDLQGVSRNATINPVASLPVESAGTNTIVVHN
jgi:hypothetical protein